jgi:hypothetical protein
MDGNPCHNHTCNTSTSVCDNSAIPDGPVPGYTPPVMNCQTEACMSGNAVIVPDDTNVPVSPTKCVINTCMNGKVLMSDANAGTSCGNNQVCDGNGHCGCMMTSDCGTPPTCKSFACTNHMCNVTNDPPETTCNAMGGHVCDGNGNCVQCASNGDCTNGTCQNGTCVLAANGHTCTNSNQCQSGHCVTGVCCGQCGGTCRACTMALTGQPDGTCADVMAGTPAPNGQCTAMACGNTGNCAAGHTCEQAAQGSDCGNGPFCNGTVLHGQQTCNGGTCGGGGTMDCAPYKCVTTGCPMSCTSSTQCSTGNVCLPGNPQTCGAPLMSGAPCTDNTQCTSMMCVMSDAGTGKVCL